MHTHVRPLAAATLLLLAPFSAPWAQTHPLNDTGITFSGHATVGNATTCDSNHPVGQDCHYGRDAAAAAGQLTKKGGGNAGFDFTKISNSGAELPASAVLGDGPDDWACTQDNVTGLMWEVKTESGLRSHRHRYSWFNTHSPILNPDGTPSMGTANGGVCETADRCDTEKYVADVNTAGLCGAADWRMPKVGELLSIVDALRISPAIDLNYFPHTPEGSSFWSSSPHVTNSNYAWSVYFGTGYADGQGTRAYGLSVRLVRTGQ